MRYADYKAKLIRRRAFIKKLIKFIPLIAILIIGLATGVTILAINYGNVNDVSDYTYNLGDKININGSAFMSETYTEYYNEDLDSWDDYPMTHAGTYKYRIVSKGNNSKYKEGTYTINPKEILVYTNDKEVGFGEKPKAISDDLINEDYISYCDFEYESLMYANTRIRPVVDTVKISDKNGLDVTSDYIILGAYQEITITACPILVKVESKEYTYDGTPKTFDTPIVQINAEGVTLKSIKYNKNYTNVGSYKLDISDIDIELEYENDTLDNYEIRLESEAILTIKPQNITVTTGDYNKTYDGEFYETSYEIEGKYYDTVSSVLSKVIVVGTWDNEATITFVDSEGNDVSNNYNINYEYGTVTIEKAELEVKPSNIKLEYDGLEHGFSELELYDGLASSDEISIINNLKYIDVTNISTNEYGINIINTLLNIDTTDCYNITYDLGNIEILPRELKIQIDDTEFDYSGEEFSIGEDDYIIISGSIVPGDIIKIYSDDTIINIGTKEANLSSYLVIRNEKDITSNYNITADSFILEVKPRPITIESGSESFEFDMEEHSITSGTIKSGSLINGHNIIYASQDSFIEVGEYIIYANNTKIYDENNIDVTDCYDINIEEGKLIIVPIKLIIKLLDRTVTYDGNSTIIYESQDFEILSGNILDCYEFQGSFTIEVNAPNIILITPLLSDISITYNGESVMGNYDISIKESSLTISKRTITITSGSITKEYAKEPLSCSNYEITSGSLASGNTISVELTGVLTKIGTTKNTFGDIYIYDSEGNNITSYYIINKVEGDLKYVYKLD